MFLVFAFDPFDMGSDFSHCSTWTGFTSVSLYERQRGRIHFLQVALIGQLGGVRLSRVVVSGFAAERSGAVHHVRQFMLPVVLNQRLKADGLQFLSRGLFVYI